MYMYMLIIYHGIVVVFHNQRPCSHITMCKRIYLADKLVVCPYKYTVQLCV